MDPEVHQIVYGTKPLPKGDEEICTQTKAVAWCFTDYNTDQGRVEAYRALNPKTLVIAMEEGTKEKKPHLQGYINFGRQVRLSQIIARVGNVHFRPRRKSEEACIQYIMDVKSYLEKSDDPHEKTQGIVLVADGVKPRYDPSKKRVYERGDVESEVVKRLRGGETVQSIHDDHPVYVYRNWRMMRSYVRLLEAWNERSDGLAAANGAGVE